MLIYLLFAFVIGKLICSNTDEGEPSNRLFACQMKKEQKCSMKEEYVLEEPVDLLLTECWKRWMKEIFKMRQLPIFKLWVAAAILQKKNREGTHGLEPMNKFKLGSLMQEHRLPSEVTCDFTKISVIF